MIENPKWTKSSVDPSIHPNLLSTWTLSLCNNITWLPPMFLLWAVSLKDIVLGDLLTCLIMSFFLVLCCYLWRCFGWFCVLCHYQNMYLDIVVKSKCTRPDTRWVIEKTIQLFLKLCVIFWLKREKKYSWYLFTCLCFVRSSGTQINNATCKNQSLAEFMQVLQILALMTK